MSNFNLKSLLYLPFLILSVFRLIIYSYLTFHLSTTSYYYYYYWYSLSLSLQNVMVGDRSGQISVFHLEGLELSANVFLRYSTKISKLAKIGVIPVNWLLTHTPPRPLSCLSVCLCVCVCVFQMDFIVCFSYYYRCRNLVLRILFVMFIFCS